MDCIDQAIAAQCRSKMGTDVPGMEEASTNLQVFLMHHNYIFKPQRTTKAHSTRGKKKTNIGIEFSLVKTVKNLYRGSSWSVTAVKYSGHCPMPCNCQCVTKLGVWSNRMACSQILVSWTSGPEYFIEIGAECLQKVFKQPSDTFHGLVPMHENPNLWWNPVQCHLAADATGKCVCSTGWRLFLVFRSLPFIQFVYIIVSPLLIVQYMPGPPVAGWTRGLHQLLYTWVLSLHTCMDNKLPFIKEAQHPEKWIIAIKQQLWYTKKK